MKKSRFITVSLLICVVVYVGMSVLSLLRRPPLDFTDDIDQNARDYITKWYEKDYRFASRIDTDAVLHAITHPHARYLFRPSVVEDGIGGRGTIMFSFENYVAIFAEKNGRWTFVGDARG